MSEGVPRRTNVQRCLIRALYPRCPCGRRAKLEDATSSRLILPPSPSDPRVAVGPRQGGYSLSPLPLQFRDELLEVVPWTQGIEIVKGHLLEREYCDCRPRRGGSRLFSEGKSPSVPLRAPQGTDAFHFSATFFSAPLLRALGRPLLAQLATGARTVPAGDSGRGDFPSPVIFPVPCRWFPGISRLETANNSAPNQRTRPSQLLEPSDR
jgi:hypothetical protein